MQADLDGGDGGHRKVGRGVVAGQCAQCPVDEVNSVFGGRPDGGEGLLHRRQDRGRGGDRASRVSVADLRRATAPQQHPQGPGQHGSAGQPGKQPRRRVCTVRRGGSRRGGARCVVRLGRAWGVRCVRRRGRRGGARRRWGGRWTGVGGLGSGDCGVGCRAPGDRARLRSHRSWRGSGLDVGAGDGQLPPGKDQVGVVQVPPVGLVGVPGGLEDPGVAVGVSELVLRDLAEGVAGADQVGGAALPGRVRGAVRGGKGQGGPGEYPPLRAVGAGVEVGDLVPAGSVAELGVRDRPQGLSRGDRVGPGPVAVPVRLCALGARRALMADGRRRPRGGGWCGAGGRRGGSLRGRSRGRGGQGRAGGEEQDGGADQSPGGGLGQRQGRQVRGRHPAQAGEHLEGDGRGQERPGQPGEHGQEAQGQRAVVARGQGCPGLLRVGNVVGDRVGPDGQEQGGQAGQDGQDGQRCAEPDHAGADGSGHCSTPPTDRVMRAWPWPVTVIEVIPMIPRNVVS